MSEPTPATILTSDRLVRRECEELIERGILQHPEAEPFDPDEDYNVEEMSRIRSRLGSMRKAIDYVNKGLAMKWRAEYPGESYTDEHTVYWVDQTKGKRIVDEDMFYAWLATKDADDLKKLVSASAIKVGGMTPAERETHLDEAPRNTDVSIKSKPRM